jgi:hypothetical protein
MFKNAMLYVLATLITLPVIAVLIVLIMALDAFVIKDIWNWFMSPILGLKTLTMKEAVGLSLVWNAFAFRVEQKKDKKQAIAHLLGLVFLWAIAYIFKSVLF